jgi:hypothetical protein
VQGSSASRRAPARASARPGSRRAG